MQDQLEVSDIDVAPAFKVMESSYRPPNFAVKAADDGSLSLGFFGADTANNLFVSPDAGSVPSDPPPDITQVNLDARQGLTDQLRAVQQSESGVNLDEEAANLIRYQQYYQANARVIDTASTIFDTIHGLRS